MRLVLVVMFACLLPSGWAASVPPAPSLDQIAALTSQVQQVLASGQPVTMPLALNDQTLSMVISRNVDGKVLLVPAPGQNAPFSTIVIAALLDANGAIAIANLMVSSPTGSVELIFNADGTVTRIDRDLSGVILAQKVISGSGLRGGNEAGPGLPGDSRGGNDGSNPGGADSGLVDGAGANQRVSTTTP